MTGQELRIFERLPREYKVEYSVLSGAGELTVVPARTLDFSETGARIQTARELKRGDSLSVRFEVPDLKAADVEARQNPDFQKIVMMCFGEVRWVSRPEGEKLFSAGVLFRHLSMVERTYLKKMLAAQIFESEAQDRVEDF
jgi:hypothetical protein